MAVKADMHTFVMQVASDGIDLKALGMPKLNLESVLADLRRLYRLD